MIWVVRSTGRTSREPLGGAGNDTLIGGAGADRLVGGAGTDYASYVTALAGVTLNLKTGVHTGDAAGDIFDGIEGFIGSSNSDVFISSADSGFIFNGGPEPTPSTTRLHPRPWMSI